MKKEELFKICEENDLEVKETETAIAVSKKGSNIAMCIRDDQLEWITEEKILSEAERIKDMKNPAINKETILKSVRHVMAKKGPSSERTFRAEDMYLKEEGEWIKGYKMYPEDIGELFESKEPGMATITFQNKWFEAFNITKKELEDAACKNDLENMDLRPMSRVLAEIMNLEPEEEEKIENDIGENEEMWVLSSKDRTFGAAMVLSQKVIRQVEKKIPHNSETERLWYLPSSMHEWIIVKGEKYLDDKTRNALQTMVKEVNSTQVEEEIQLGDTVYSFPIDAYDKETFIAYKYEEDGEFKVIEV